MTLAPVPAEMPAALYGRQSRDNQESITEQLDVLREVCAAEQWPIFGEYQDGVSASRFSRKARESWDRLMADLRDGRFRVLLLWESSRGDRDLESWVSMLARCREGRVSIYIHTHERLYNLENARDWKVLVEDGTDSAYESEKTSLRWRRHTAARAAAGKPHSFVRYGWIRKAVLDGDGVLVGHRDELHPHQAAVVRDVAGSFLEGESLRSIAARLNAAGERTNRGNRWSESQLRQVLLRDSNAGLRIHKAKVVGKGDWDPIFDEDTHNRVVTKLNDPARRTSKGSARRWLGSGLYRCGRPSCPGVVRANTVHVEGKPPRTGYQCSTCMRVRRSQPDVDGWVEANMITRLSRPDAVALLAEGDPGRAQELRDEVAGLEARLLSFADQAAEGAIDAAQLARINAKLRPQISAAKTELAACHPNPGVMRLAGPDAADRWAAAPLEVRRSVVEALAVVTILPTGAGGRFDPASVRIVWRRAAGEAAR